MRCGPMSCKFVPDKLRCALIFFFFSISSAVLYLKLNVVHFNRKIVKSRRPSSEGYSFSFQNRKNSELRYAL